MKLLLTLDGERIARNKNVQEQQPLHIRFEFQGVRIRVCTNSSYLADHLRLGYRFFEAPGSHNESHVSLLALQAGGPQYNKSVRTLFPSRTVRDHVLTSQELGLVFLFNSGPLLLYYSVKVLFGEVIRLLRRRFLAFHAATLAHQGRGLMLCGAARCGKTLLTALLMDKGFGCCSDDVTLLMRSSLKVAAFPRALTIRREYESLLAPLLAKARQVQRFKVADQERLLVDLEHTVPTTVEPRVICFPRFEPTGGTHLEPISPSTALAALMHHRFHPLAGCIDEHNEQDFEVLFNLLSRVSCYSIVYSDPMEAAVALKNSLFGE